MKRKARMLILCAFALIFLAVCAVLSFQDELVRYGKRLMREQVALAISKYGTSLQPVDEIRLLHIEEPGAQPDLGRYQVPFDVPFRSSSDMTIVAERIVIGQEAQDLASEWRRLHLHTDYMAGCFDPHHVIQFRNGGRTVCEVITCFMCGNTTLPAFPTTTLVSFESIPKHESPDYLSFRAHVERLVGAHKPPPLPPKNRVSDSPLPRR